MEPNRYFALGINKHADLNKVKHSYRAAAWQHRPGIEGDDSESVIQPWEISWDSDRFYSVTDELLKGFLPGFFDRPVDHEKDFYVDLALSPADMIEGGYFPVALPVMIECPLCRESEIQRRSGCRLCFGYGRIETTRSFSIYVPPATRNGAEDSLPLDDIGLKGSRLHITLIISEE